MGDRAEPWFRHECDKGLLTVASLACVPNEGAGDICLVLAVCNKEWPLFGLADLKTEHVRINYITVVPLCKNMH